MRITDVHCHLYPDAIAARAVSAIGAFYSLPMEETGTSSAYLEAAAACGITRAFVHSAAVTAGKVRAIDDFIAGQAREHAMFTGFGTLHPDDPDALAELSRAHALGLRGIKIHPDFQRFPLDDERLVPLFQTMADLGMVLIAHTGDARYPYSEPARMARALSRVSGLKVVCAHLGGWSVWARAWEALSGRAGVFVDTSSSLYALAPRDAAAIIRRYGVENVLFGTDYPMWSPSGELARFLALPLTRGERDAILFENAERLIPA